MRIEVRPLTPEDRARVLEISSQIWDGDDWVPEALDSWFRTADGEAVAAVLDGVYDWVTRNGNADDDTKRVGILAYLLLKRLDDIAYGLGLWSGVVRERHAGALKPQIRT